MFFSQAIYVDQPKELIEIPQIKDELVKIKTNECPINKGIELLDLKIKGRG